MTDDKQGLFRTDEHGRIDLEGMEAAAEKNRQEKEENRRKVWKAKEERARKRTDAINDLLKKTGDQVTADNEAEAQRRIKEAKKQADRDEERIRRETNTRQESDLDRAYKDLLADKPKRNKNYLAMLAAEIGSEE